MLWNALAWIYKLYIVLAVLYIGFEWTAYGWRERDSTAPAVVQCAGKIALTALVFICFIYLFWLR